MNHEPTQGRNHADVRLCELRWIRRWWWALSAGAFLALTGWFRYGWYWITLDPRLVRADLLHRPGLLLLLAIASCGLPMVWWLCAKVDIRFALSTRRVPWAPLLAVMALLAAEWLACSFSGQTALWLAVRSRLRASGQDFFANELSLLRLETLVDQPTEGAQVFIVTGSSQVLHALDCDVLRAEHLDWKIKRRALAGMTPLKLTMMRNYLSLEPGCVVMLYLSENEFVEGDLIPNWNRPTMSPEGFRHGWTCFSSGDRMRKWRGWLDLWVASRSELWRSRDYVRHILAHPFGSVAELERPSGPANAESILDDAYADIERGRRHMAIHFKAVKQIFELTRSRRGSLVIFEGQSNPDYFSDARNLLRAEVRALLSAWAADHGVLYVRADEQSVRFDAEEWLDPVHVNQQGRNKFTSYISEWLSSQGGP